jgi:hypothetical protein
MATTHAPPQPNGRRAAEQLSPRNDPLPRTLGWASLALGVPQTAAPGTFDRAIGVRDDGESRMWTLLVGARELAAAAGILALGRPRPVPWLWARVAGDAMDLTLLASALRGKPRHPGRVMAAAAAVVAITAADVLAAMRMSMDPDRVAEPGPLLARATVTVRGSVDEVRARWEREAPELPGSPKVRFVPAPGGRGTEIHAELEYDPRGGAPAAVGAMLIGSDPDMQLHDGLRRFKQLLETGIVVRSEGTPEGPSARRLIKQRPAQPLEGSPA